MRRQRTDRLSPPFRRGVRRGAGTAALALAAALAAACAGPAASHGRDPVAAARRVLAVDFGGRHGDLRGDRLARWPARAGRELARLPGLASIAPTARAEFARPATLAADARSLAAHELERRPDPSRLSLPTAQRLGQHLADDLAAALGLFGTWDHPLDEIDDRRHRTRFDDDRPEATLWQRLRRRLGL